jgi:hypothetical protein
LFHLGAQLLFVHHLCLLCLFVIVVHRQRGEFIGRRGGHMEGRGRVGRALSTEWRDGRGGVEGRRSKEREKKTKTAKLRAKFETLIRITPLMSLV